MATDDSDIATLAGETLELADVLNTALDKGVILHGDVTIAVADIDLIKLNLGLLLGAIETVSRQTDTTLRHESGSPASSHTTTTNSGEGRARPTLAGTLGAPKLGPVPQPTDSARQSPPKAASHFAAEVPQSATPVTKAAKDDHLTASDTPETSLNAVAQGLPSRINAEAAGVESGLARLVLTLIEVLRKVLEHQAVRRMDGGKLSAAEIERLGLALSRLNDRMQELKNVFGLTDDDLHIDLGPLGRVR